MKVSTQWLTKLKPTSFWLVQSCISCINLYIVFCLDAYLLLVLMWTALFHSCSPPPWQWSLAYHHYPINTHTVILHLFVDWWRNSKYYSCISLTSYFAGNNEQPHYLWTVAVDPWLWVHTLHCPISNEFLLNNMVVYAFAQPLLYTNKILAKCCEYKS